MKAVVDYMLSRGEIQGSTPDQHLFRELSRVVRACISSRQELEAGRLEVQGHLHRASSRLAWNTWDLVSKYK